MFPTNFKERREKLLNSLTDAIAIIPGATHVTKSHDTEYPFRQNSNFKYLTGFNEPDSILVLTSYPEKKSILFVREKDPFMEMWSGRRMGPEKALEILEVDETHTVEQFSEMIEKLLLGHEKLYMDLFDEPKTFAMVRDICKKLYHRKKTRASSPPKNFFHLNPLIERMRLVKDQNEIQFMKTAMIATNKAHRAAMALAAPGRNEKEINALMQYLFTKDLSQGNAYDNIIASGDNANILHYIENNAELKDGDLLLIDAGSELNLYATDITRTFPVNGKFSKVQTEVYEIVLEAQKTAISHAWIGRTLKEVHEHTCRVLTQGLIDLKVLKGSVDENIETAAFRKYYPHGTGHWLGLDVHDQNPYQTDEYEETKFEDGVIFTVEPGLYFPKSDATLPEHLRGIGIRIEDNILITQNGHENLSAMIPKEIKEIEEACAKDYKDFLL